MKGGTLAVRQPLYLLSQKLLQDIDALQLQLLEVGGSTGVGSIRS